MTRWHFLTLILSISLPICSAAIAADKPAEAKSQRRNSRHMQQFFREGYRPPSLADEESKKMKALVDKLNSMSLSKEKLQQLRDAEIAETKVEPPVAPKPVVVTKPKPKKPKSVLSPKRLAMLRAQSQKEVANPIRLADALYGSGHHSEAYDIYNMCLKQGLSADDASWVMFQMANCQAKTKPREAQKLLQKLMSEYPESPWSMLAENQNMMLQWRYEFKPKKILKESYDLLDEMIEQRRKALSRTAGQKSSAGQGPRALPVASR